jgi:copper chaperone CopZ
MATRTETKVELTGVHLCCYGCVNAADEALMSVEGVRSCCDMENGTITLTAKNDAAAQKALDALAAAGFYGNSGNQNLMLKPLETFPPGKVKSVKVSGIHNCCGPCCDAIQEAVNTVQGVTGDTAKPGMKTFAVTGEFYAADLVRALNRAGFSAQVKQ